MKLCSHFIYNFVTFPIFLSCVTSVKFAPGTKNNDGKRTAFEAKNTIQEEVFTDLGEAELRRIVAEGPLDDPLNAFFDPHESYRFSNYAYNRSIPFPNEHSNPPIPPGFLPQNGPQKSFPVDFFDLDSKMRKIILTEHAAASCPFLRKWREKNPLKPFPIGPDFVQKHPPIKYNTRKGYEIDFELARLNDLTDKIQFDIYNEKELKKKSSSSSKTKKSQNRLDTITEPKNTDSESSIEASDNPKDVSGKGKMHDLEKKGNQRESHEMKLLLKSIKIVQKLRKDCRLFKSFTNASKAPPSYRLDAPLSCLEDAILYMDELEDIYYPVRKEDEIPERLDKVNYYADLLSRLKQIEKENKLREKNKETERVPSKHRASKYEQNESIPLWAKASDGSPLYSDTEEVKLPESYGFTYRPVPFPSIQNTLQKYVGI